MSSKPVKDALLGSIFEHWVVVHNPQDDTLLVRSRWWSHDRALEVAHLLMKEKRQHEIVAILYVEVLDGQ